MLQQAFAKNEEHPMPAAVLCQPHGFGRFALNSTCGAPAELVMI